MRGLPDVLARKVQAATTSRTTPESRASASAARRSTSSPAGGRSRTRPIASPTVTLETSKSPLRSAASTVVALLAGQRAQLVLAAVPAVDEGVAHEPPGVGAGPIAVANDVVDGGPHRLVAAGGNHARLGRRVDPSLLRRPESGPDQDAVSAEHQGGGDAAAIGDPAGRQHQHLRSFPGDKVDDIGDEGDRAAGPQAVSARLGALCDEHVRADGERAAGVIEIVNLADQGNAGGTDRRGERSRVSEGQHHGCRLVRQR